jgi:integrase/recombinase XerD
MELVRLTLKNLDLNKGIIYPETAKHGTPRALKLKPQTLNMLNNLIETRNPSINERIWGRWSSNIYGKLFRHSRNKTSKKLQKPAIKTIRLYDLRHFFATMLYRETRDILYVKQQLGHNNIKNTLIYTQLLMDEVTENYTCKIAETKEQMIELIEHGFTFVHEKDGVAYFKKRK